MKLKMKKKNYQSKHHELYQVYQSPRKRYLDITLHVTSMFCSFLLFIMYFRFYMQPNLDDSLCDDLKFCFYFFLNCLFFVTKESLKEDLSFQMTLLDLDDAIATLAKAHVCIFFSLKNCASTLSQFVCDEPNTFCLFDVFCRKSTFLLTNFYVCYNVYFLVGDIFDFWFSQLLKHSSFVIMTDCK